MKPPQEYWHQRFVRQAQWTQAIRHFLYQKFLIDQAPRILEVGCGSGVILNDLPTVAQAQVYGLDIEPAYLTLAMRNAPAALLTQGDAHQLPYQSNTIDLCICHFLLLWVDFPLTVLREMLRITHPRGYVCALAEPDYGGRIDFPPELAILGQSQMQALANQGADPLIGRQLRSLFTAAGLVNVTSGVLGGQWEMPFNRDEWESEWGVLEKDLGQSSETQAALKEQKKQDLEAWVKGNRILYVPTFYAYGQKPG